MKIFFYHTSIGEHSKHYSEHMKYVYAFLTERGHSVTEYAHIVKAPTEEFETVLALMHSADIIVIEVSYPTFTSGFLLAHAASKEKKKCLIFYNKELANTMPPSVIGNTFKQIYSRSYEDITDFINQLKLFLL